MDDQKLSSDTLPESGSQQTASQRAGTGFPTGTIVLGLVLVFIGGIFLLQNLTNFTFPLHNWWALFILIPAFAAFGKAFEQYRSAGNRFTNSMRGSLLGGSILTIIALTFLLNLNWTWIGPMILILIGLSVLSKAFLSDRA